MAAYLYPGIRSLQLVLDKPYDTIRTTDFRDDLESVKVWYSTTSGFNPNNGQGTLVPSGNSLSIVIPELEPNTRYYVKYAFISAIDSNEEDPAGPSGPGSYTVSAELTEIVLDETVSVYGYLTNDPTAVAVESDGSGGDYSLTEGVFKVYNLSTDVTGAGPVYGVIPGEVYGGVVPYINQVTGRYYAESMTGETGAVKFFADYDGIRVEKVWNIFQVRAGVDATDAILLQLSANGNAFVYEDETAATTVAGSITLSAQLQNITGTVTFAAKAFTRAGVELGAVTGTQTGATYSISSAQFNPVTYNNTVGYVVVTATLGTVSDTFTIYRINNGSEQITVEQSNQTHTIASFADGSVPTANYVGSGNIIKVKQGNAYLSIDNTSPYQVGTWRISTIFSTGITADTTPIIGADYQNFDQHASMTADTAFIDYTITGKTTTGKDFETVVRQSFSKSKAGVAGSNAPVVTLTASNQVFIIPKNGGTATPTTTTLTAQVINIASPVYAWSIDGTVQAGATTSTLTVSSFTSGTKLIKVTVTSGTTSVYDQLSLYAIKEGDDALVGGLENENQTISCDPTGAIIAGQLPVTSKFVVVRGSEVLTSGVVYSKVSGTESGMTSTINATTGVISITAMSAATAASTTYRATIGTTQINAVLTLNKSRDGAAGASVTGPTGPTGNAGIASRVIYYKALQSATPITATPENTTGGTSLPTTPVTWLSTAPAAGVGEVVFYSYGRYNPNSVAFQGIAADTTVWSAPIAASIFQDIRSDNWKWNNGTADQTGAPNLTAWKTYPTGVGYYFKKDDGTLWATSAYLKGNVLALGTTTALQVQITVAGGNNYVYPALSAFSNTELPTNIANNIRAGISGVCETTINSTWNVGVVGTGSGTGTTVDANGATVAYNKGIGVFGSGDGIGGVFEAKVTGATGLLARNLFASGFALSVDGKSNFTGAMSVTGAITATGNITAYTSSDRNLKENILTIKSALDKLQSIGGYTYDWKDSVIESRGGEDGYFVRKSDVGVIAQEVLEVVPQAVATRTDGTLAVDYQKLIPLLIEAVKELDRRTR